VRVVLKGKSQIGTPVDLVKQASRRLTEARPLRLSSRTYVSNKSNSHTCVDVDHSSQTHELKH